MGVQLYPCRFEFWQGIKIAKNRFQYMADVALDRQFITIGLFPHGAIYIVDLLTYLLV